MRRDDGVVTIPYPRLRMYASLDRVDIVAENDGEKLFVGPGSATRVVAIGKHVVIRFLGQWEAAPFL